MRGFTNEALLLYPRWDAYENKPYAYKSTFRRANENLVKYLLSQDITPYAFFTDDIARDLNNPGVKYIRTLSFPDARFAQENCPGMGNVFTEMDDRFSDLVQKSLAKLPISADESDIQRFDSMMKRNNAVIRQIIPTFDMVCHFSATNRNQYKVTSKEGDGKIRVIVNADTFLPKTLMSGHEENPADLLGVPYAFRVLNMWEVTG